MLKSLKQLDSVRLYNCNSVNELEQKNVLAVVRAYDLRTTKRTGEPLYCTNSTLNESSPFSDRKNVRKR